MGVLDDRIDEVYDRLTAHVDRLSDRIIVLEDKVRELCVSQDRDVVREGRSHPQGGPDEDQEPRLRLYDRRGGRLIVKLKTRDF